ncbi:hypothetical protein ACR3I8_17370 [Priestia flexa]
MQKVYFMMSLLLLYFLAACQENNSTEQVTQSKHVESVLQLILKEEN